MDQPTVLLSNIRLKNELKTIEAMLRIYCEAHHDSTGESLCSECTELKSYATKRLLHCPFQQDKPTCGNCTIHCYKMSMRKKIQDVMKFSGPKMIFRHPIMALRHLFDSQRNVPKIENN